MNVSLVLWHLAGPFDLAERNRAVHVWLMHGSFFVFGVLFWLQFIESRPFKVRLRAVDQIGAVMVTAVVMWVIAMALSIFSKGAWYPWYRVHEGPLLPPFADQQIGAGIMWVCGDFWAVPAMIRAVRRMIGERGEGARTGDAFDRALDALLRSARGGRPHGALHAELAGLAPDARTRGTRFEGTSPRPAAPFSADGRPRGAPPGSGGG